jgi:putative multiple sugar transport system permease protein
MAVLNNGLQLLGVGADLTQIIKGLVLLIAVAFDVYNKSQGKRSIIGLLTQNFNRPSAGGPSNPLQPDETTSTKEAIAREA